MTTVQENEKVLLHSDVEDVTESDSPENEQQCDDDNNIRSQEKEKNNAPKPESKSNKALITTPTPILDLPTKSIGNDTPVTKSDSAGDLSTCIIVDPTNLPRRTKRALELHKRLLCYLSHTFKTNKRIQRNSKQWYKLYSSGTFTEDTLPTYLSEMLLMQFTVQTNTHRNTDDWQKHLTSYTFKDDRIVDKFLLQFCLVGTKNGKVQLRVRFDPIPADF